VPLNDGDHLDAAAGEPVDDPMAAFDDLAHVLCVELWNSPTGARRFGGGAGPGLQAQDKSSRFLRIGSTDVARDLAQIAPRPVRPNDRHDVSEPGRIRGPVPWSGRHRR